MNPEKATLAKSRLAPLRPDKASVLVIVIGILVLLVTLSLGGSAYLAYRGESKEKMATLEKELSTTANELATSLTLPVWYLDEQQVARILDNLMERPVIQEVRIQIQTGRSETVGRFRKPDGTVQTGSVPPPPPGSALAKGLIKAEQPVTFAGRTIGQVHVVFTTRYLEAELRRVLKNTLISLISLDLLLTASLFLLLWLLVLRPLQEIQGLAEIVSSGAMDQVEPSKSIFFGELASLQLSLIKTFELLRERFTSLQVSEERFRVLIESTTDLIWSVDLEGRLLSFNSSFAEYIRRSYGKEPHLGDTAELLLPPDRASRWPPFYSRVFKDGSFRQEYSVSGEVVLELAFNPIKRENKVLAVSIFGKDITDRKLAEFELHQLNLFQRTILDNAAYGIISTAPDGMVTSFNHAAERMLGYTADEVIGKQTPAYWHDPEEVAQYALHLSEELGEPISPGFGVFAARPRRDLPEEHEWTFIRKDGTRVPVLLSVTALRAESGKINGFVGLTYDLTERKRDEDALHRLYRELRAVSDCNQILVRAENEQSLLNDICHIVCDKAGYRMAWVGYVEHDDAKTVRPVAWAGFDSGYIANAQLTWADDVERGQGPTGKAVRRGETICVQDIATDPQMAPWRESASRRGYRSSIALPLKEKSGEVFGIFMIYSSESHAFTTEEIRLLEELSGDLAFGITVLRIRLEHQRAEETLGQLAAIVASSDDAIVGKTLDGIITSWNQGAERIYGYAQGEVVGKSISILVPAGREDEIPEILDRIKSGEHIEHYESVRQRKDGQQIHMSLTISPVYGSQGQVVAASAVGRDITEKQRLEEQLRQAQKMEAIGQLAGGVAHDFNNILTAIIGFSNLAKMKMKPDDPQQPLIDHILASSDRAAHLTQSLLAFSRKQVLQPKPVDLNAIVKNIEKLLGRLIGEDIEFTTRMAEQSLIVMADAGQLEQVLMNLVTNARDAMPEGGELSIATEMKVLGKDFTDAHGYGRPGGHALVTVSDTGIGMDEATQGKIFEPFFTTKEKGKGTGLGLAMVYGIVKQHEGNISVYSEPGKGTTFKILLPLIALEAEKASAGTSEPPPGGTETLLLAEDDPDVRLLTATVLKDFGYRVIEAVDGKDALEQYRLHAKEIDLLILDVIMPKLSGKEVHDAVRAQDPGAKILLISGYTADFINRKGTFGEGVPVVAKPISPFELLKKVRSLLDGTG